MKKPKKRKKVLTALELQLDLVDRLRQIAALCDRTVGEVVEVLLAVEMVRRKGRS